MSNFNHIFICNTPFQYYFSSKIISYSGLKDFLIVSTFKRKNGFRTNELYVPNIVSLIRLLSKIKDYQYISFYLPHIHGYITFLIYKLFFGKKNVEFNIYYEGIALFRPNGFSLRSSFKRKCFKQILGIIRNRDCDDDELIPKGLKQKSTVYTPIECDFLFKNYQRTIKIQSYFKKNSAFDQSLVILFLSPYETKESLKNILDKSRYSEKFKNSKIIVKPHFNTKPEVIEDIKSNYEILDYTLVGESVVELLKPSILLFSHFSSLILNAYSFGYDRSSIFLSKSSELPSLDLEFDIKQLFTPI